MSDIDKKVLQILEALRDDVTGIKTDITALREGQRTLEEGQKTLETGQQALDLKIEAVHAYQKQAHTEIMGHVVDIAEASGHDHKELEKRVERTEKHLGLPPVK